LIKQKVLVWVYRLVLGGEPEYLLLRRPPAKGSVWQPVTGGARESEPLLAAATRELAEETGIGAGAASFRTGGDRQMLGRVLPQGISYGFVDSKQRRLVETVFARCAPEDAPIVLSREHVHGRWFSRQQALTRLRWDGQRDALRLLDLQLSRLYAGLDVSLAPPAGPSVALVDSSGRLVAWANLREDLQTLRWLPTTTVLASVNAPLTLPFGMGRCCLEPRPDCHCTPVGGTSGRLADRMLMRQGIARAVDLGPASPRKPWILRALELGDLLKRRRIPSLEVSALASRRRLLGQRAGGRQPRSRMELQRALSQLIPGMPTPSEELLDSGQLDAVTCAYVAWLHGEGRSEWIGDPAEGAIALPVRV
jgi:8-oxo-dGTP pyrophosphatase MutT (NUDIX family)